MILRNDHVLVFGGDGGIGTAVCKRLVSAGAEITVIGRNEEKIKNVVNEIKSEQLHYIVGDITVVDEHINLFKKADKLMGGLDAFINATGLGASKFGKGYDPWNITSEEWDQMSDVNYKGAFFFMRNAIDYMITNKRKGNLLSFASNAACMPIFGQYGSSKLAIKEWTKAFAQQYGHYGIVINAIAPGATFTPMIERYAKSIDQKYPRHALERFIRPEEIAELVLYLMSDFGEIICGDTVVADAGDYGHVLKQNDEGNYYYG